MKHVNKILAGLITCCVILLLSGCSPRQGEKHDFSIGKGTFLLDGKPFVIKAGGDTLHPYPRRILATSYSDVQGTRHEYDLYLCVLEYP